MNGLKLYVDSYPSIDANEYAKVSKLLGTSMKDLLKTYVGEDIGITSSRVTFGIRLWFLCPECRGRVRKLYNAEEGYTCRKCLGLKYRDQEKHRNKYFESFIRPIKKLKKIEQKLNKRLTKDNREQLQQEYQLLTSRINVSR